MKWLTAKQGVTGETCSASSKAAWTMWFTVGPASSPSGSTPARHHGHFTVNGKRVNIPSYLVKPGDVIEVAETSRSSVKFSKLTGEDAPMVTVPRWLERGKEFFEGRCRCNACS